MFARSRFVAVLIASFGLTLACQSNAVAFPVTWTLSGVQFADGGTATGYFVYDADASTISSWLIQTQGGNTAAMPAFTYDSTMSSTPTLAPLAYYNTGSPFVGPLISTWNPASHFLIRELQLPVSSGLSDAGGTVSIALGSNAYECIDCAPYRNITAGSLIGTAAPNITSANSTTFVVSAAGSFTVTSTGAPAATLTESGALPSGVTFVDNGNGTATLAGTPAAGTANTYPLTLTAHNTTAPDATQSFTLIVGQSPAITSSAATTFTVGTAGTFTVTTTGVPAAALSESGTLPAGVNFVDNGNGTATLSGTPAAGSGGQYPLTLNASNGVLPNATQSFTLTVDAAPAITSANATTFTVGTPGTFTVTTTGYPPTAALSASGTLPAGVTFVDNGNGTGTLSGTPTTTVVGPYPLTLTASNGVLPNATQSFTLTLIGQPPAITSAAEARFVAGAAETFTVITTGIPAAALSESGALPAGVTFVDNGNGTATIAGTTAAVGDYVITITANNGVAPAAVQSFTLHVAAIVVAPMFDGTGMLAFLMLMVAVAYLDLRQKKPIS